MVFRVQMEPVDYPVSQVAQVNKAPWVRLAYLVNVEKLALQGVWERLVVWAPGVLPVLTVTRALLGLKVLRVLLDCRALKEFPVLRAQKGNLEIEALLVFPGIRASEDLVVLQEVWAQRDSLAAGVSLGRVAPPVPRAPLVLSVCQVMPVPQDQLVRKAIQATPDPLVPVDRLDSGDLVVNVELKVLSENPARRVQLDQWEDRALAVRLVFLVLWVPKERRVLGVPQVL